MIQLRKTLITEEWAIAHEWMMENSAAFGADEDDMPDVYEFMEDYVPTFTDSVGLLIDDELIAVGLLDDDCHVHLVLNPSYPNKISQIKAVKNVLMPYAKKRYKCLYTEFVSDDVVIEKWIKFLGFCVLPQPLNKRLKQAAMIIRNTKDGKPIQSKKTNYRKRSGSGEH